MLNQPTNESNRQLEFVLEMEDHKNLLLILREKAVAAGAWQTVYNIDTQIDAINNAIELNG